MKTLLVLAAHPEFPSSVRTALNPEEFRVVHRAEISDAEPLFHSGNVDAVVIDVEQDDVRSLWTIEKLRRIRPQCPIIAFTAVSGWDLAEEAYLQGVSYILPKPVRRRLLTDILQRALQQQGSAVAPPDSPRPVAPMSSLPSLALPRLAADTDALQAFKSFSGILGGSLSIETLLQRSLKVLRGMLAVNRAAVFLRLPGALPGQNIDDISKRSFRAACTMGLPADLLGHFELSFETGIGGTLNRTGRILLRDSPEALADSQIQKEFELLGANVAVPVIDPNTLVGIAVFDNHITGERWNATELSALFEIFEELGLALRNVWLHDQLAANHRVLTGVVQEFGSACVVVNRELAVLHANKAARHYFSRRRSAELEFNDLPPALGSKLYQVLQTGSAIAPFKFNPPDAPENIYQVTITPVQTGDQADALPSSALLLVEDRSHAEDLKRLEADASSLQQVKTIGGRLAHEINNAVMPLHLIQQELEKRVKDRDLTSVLGDSVKRIARRGAQMRALAQDSIISRNAFALGEVLQEAADEAQRNQPGTNAKLNINVAQLLMVNGDREAMKLALSEVLLNAIQANSKDPKVSVTSQIENESKSAASVTIEVQDNGPGFSAEALQNALKPFYTTKTVGLGVGLSVAEKIISLHRGKLTIGNAAEGTGGVVRIKLPVEVAPAKERAERPEKRAAAA